MSGRSLFWDVRNGIVEMSTSWSNAKLSPGLQACYTVAPGCHQRLDDSFEGTPPGSDARNRSKSIAFEIAG